MFFDYLFLYSDLFDNTLVFRRKNVIISKYFSFLNLT